VSLVNLLSEFITGQNNFTGMFDNNTIATIKMMNKRNLSFTAQKIGNLCCQSSQWLTGGV
jgi:hypothetical protein